MDKNLSPPQRPPAGRGKTQPSVAPLEEGPPSSSAGHKNTPRARKKKVLLSFGFISIFLLLSLTLGWLWQQMRQEERKLAALQAQVDGLMHKLNQALDPILDVTSYDQKLSYVEKDLLSLKQHLEENGHKFGMLSAEIKSAITSFESKRGGIEELQKRLEASLSEAHANARDGASSFSPLLADLFSQTVLLKVAALSGAPLKEILDHLFLIAKDNETLTKILTPLSLRQIRNLVPLPQLLEEFRKLIPKIMEAMRPLPTGFWPTTLHHLKSLVVIRRLGDAAKADPVDDKVNHLEAALQIGNMEEVLTLVRGLPDPTQAVLASWAKQVEDHHSVSNILKVLDAYLLKNLKRSPPLPSSGAEET